MLIYTSLKVYTRLYITHLLYHNKRNNWLYAYLYANYMRDILKESIENQNRAEKQELSNYLNAT